MSFRFAIVGCGQIARRHAQEISRHGKLVAVCDSVDSAAQSLGNETGATVYTDINKLLNSEEVDILVVSSPNGLHPSHTIAGLQAGCHVLCEKPLAITVKDAMEMYSCAKAYGRQLFVVKQNRFNEPVQVVKKLIDNQLLGKIISFQLNGFWNRPVRYYQESNWRGTLSLDGGPLYTQFSHFMDLLSWWLGAEDVIHSAVGMNYLHKDVIEFEDTGMVSLQMKNGAIGTIQYTLNCHSSNMEGALALFGEKGTVKIGGPFYNDLIWFSVDGMDKPVMKKIAEVNNYGYYQGSMRNHGPLYDNMVKVLRNQEVPIVDPDEAIQCIATIEHIYSVMRAK